MAVRKGKIGVFDSGFGGLSILKEIVKKNPDYHYLYLGDTARTPYGNRSQESIYRFTKEAVDFLFQEGAELVIIACNTSSAEALRKIQREHLPKAHAPHRRVLGVIVPTLEAIAESGTAKYIGILATESTVRSGTFPEEMKKFAPRVKVFQQAAPLLVPLVEAGEHESKAGHMILEEYLKPLIQKKIDTLVLACTHYGHLEPMIRAKLPKHISIISEGTIVARKMKEYLGRHPEIEGLLSKKKKIDFYTTDLSEKFKTLGKFFFGKPIHPKRAVLG